jgi:hypothetical protein
VLDIPTGDTARDRWLALDPDERRKILRDGAAGQAQGLPELARIAAGWARTAADESRHRTTGYLAAVLVGAAGGLAVGGLLPPFARIAGLLWFGLVCVVALLAARVEAQQRQVYAWVEACNLNYLLSLEAMTVPAPEGTYAVNYHAPPGRYAILVVAGLLPLGAAIGTGIGPLTVALALLVATRAAAVLGRDAQRRTGPLAVLRPTGLDLPKHRLVVPWSEVGWVFVGIRGRRYAVGVHWVLRSPETGEELADRAAIEPHHRTRLRRKLKDDPRFTLPSLLCREAPETLVLRTAAVQFGQQSVPSQLPGNRKAPVISGP